MPVNLEAAGWNATILPETGGAVASLRHHGRHVLRPFSEGTPDVLDCASFPLVPFVNRIGKGRLWFSEQAVQLDADPAALPHALHGHGWRTSWRVENATESQLVMSFDHCGQDSRKSRGWPWSYRAEQRIGLGISGMTIDIAVTNTGQATAMPCGTGIHPYFIRRKTSTVQFTASRMWANSDDGLAQDFVAATHFISGQSELVEQLEGLDNFFPCTGPVMVVDGEMSLAVGGDGMAGVHIYVPRGKDYFCVEPVSHAPDAFGRGEYERRDIIAPGATARWRWQITDEPKERGERG